MELSKVQHTALEVLQQLLANPYADFLADLHLEDPLTDRLVSLLGEADALVPVPALEVTLAALNLRAQPARGHKRIRSKDTPNSPLQSTFLGPNETERLGSSWSASPQLAKCLVMGFSSRANRPVLEHWVSFLSACLPFFAESIFQMLIPLVECLCSQVNVAFEDMKASFDGKASNEAVTPETRVVALLAGLEHCLAYAHESLLAGRSRNASVKSHEPQPGFLINMVSGVFNAEAPQTKTAGVNNRLSVLLSFKDAVRTCYEIWSWGRPTAGGSDPDSASAASLVFTSTRTRNKARRLLEHLIAAEPLECLENLVEVWCKALQEGKHERRESVTSLLHVLDGSKPKNTIPALFNAIYSRTNPHALDPLRKSSLTSDLSDTDLAAFLSAYSQSVDDDAMDEIWADCMTFLRDVLSNPFPHRQILPSLLEFTATLGEKVDNTNFGDQRMRRDLSDLFVRLLTATFTIKPVGFSSDYPAADKSGDRRPGARGPARGAARGEVLPVLAAIVPKLPQVLIDTERIQAAAYIISNSAIVPALKSKLFPDNVSFSMLDVLYQLSRLPHTQKFWKKDVAEAFHHPRFFASPLALVEGRWMLVVRQWALGDADRMTELVARLAAPSAAGMVFGVGAASARAEADRKTQLTLRRIALLVLASDADSFAGQAPGLAEKMEELLTATTTSSPSTAIRAEIYMLLRALILRLSSVHLAALWSVIHSELHAALSSLLPGHDPTALFHEPAILLQACKLLDTLVVLAPEEFQLQTWLFVTDSIDAMYGAPSRNRSSSTTQQPPPPPPVALVDQLSHELGNTIALTTPTRNRTFSFPPPVSSGSGSGSGSGSAPLLRQPLLARRPEGMAAAAAVARTPAPGAVSAASTASASASASSNARDDLVRSVLRPFFGQLSIAAFEHTYSMAAPDREACVAGLLSDLFDERTVVGGGGGGGGGGI
ncbi:MAG: hypothetical protein M1826_003628 [Phylliscum demangeonii]|nr:MAG: hypothetical protein M1826_003628 [Phylliscum demangeonii]